MLFFKLGFPKFIFMFVRKILNSSVGFYTQVIQKVSCKYKVIKIVGCATLQRKLKFTKIFFSSVLAMKQFAHFRGSENAGRLSKMLAGEWVNRKCLVRLCRAFIRLKILNEPQYCLMIICYKTQ